MARSARTMASTTGSTAPRVGFVPSFDALIAPHAQRRQMISDAAALGIDHVGVVDHVSFHEGEGYDGIVHTASLLSLEPDLSVYLGLYLLPLRHPLPVARQLATVAELAPGRLTFAVGIGGESRAEVANCGVDPRSRGRRMDECLTVLRALLTGEPVTFHGEHISLDEATVRPAPDPPIPIVVGGRSDAAHRRVARFGDGWLGIWVSADRYEKILRSIADEASEVGRDRDAWDHAMSVWVGFGDDAEEGRAHLAPAMEATYRVPFEDFERWSPCGTPAEVAAFLAPYVDAGAKTLNLMPRAGSSRTVAEGVAEVRDRLLARVNP